MRVTFDISKLASDWSSQKRTGIGRVVEHLALELCASPECELTFSCIATPFLRQARQGARAHPQFSKVPLPQPLHRRVLRAANERARGSIGKAPRRVQRALSPAEKLLQGVELRWGLEGRPIDLRSLAQTQVFHSPMHPLPPMPFKKAPPRVLTVYDLIPLRHPEFFKVENSLAVQALMRSILDSAAPGDWVICPSQATLDDFCDYRGHKIERAFVIPLAADPQLFHPRSGEREIHAARQKYAIREGAYFLSVCKLEPRKNVAHMARAFLQMVTQQKVDDATLVIAGTSAWGMAEIEAVIAACPDAKRRAQVQFIGHVADADLAALYRGAHAFLYLSVIEGFGLPPLEAMQCGAPVIATNCSSLPEVVGKAGVLLAPNDVDGLASALWHLYNDSSLRREYSQKSLARAALFSWKRCAQDTLNAYRRAISEHNSPMS